MRKPTYIDFHPVDGKVKSISVRRPYENMQTDSAAFESWCVILKAKGEIDEVVVDFDELKPDDMTGAKKYHYNRFLYRLYKFALQMDSWVSIAEKNKRTINDFISSMRESVNINNYPDSDSEFNERKGLEHILEKAFTGIPEFRKKNGIVVPVYDQLPNGLFKELVSEKNRIMNTGYFDLWAIDESGSFCIFELKEPRNKKAGVISELFFYANLANSLLSGDLGCKLNNPSNMIRYRGYDKLQINIPKKVKAYFLVNELHPEVDENMEEVIKILNTNTSIRYDVLKYEWDPEEELRIVEQLNLKYKLEERLE